jgi:hypothetical protein
MTIFLKINHAYSLRKEPAEVTQYSGYATGWMIGVPFLAGAEKGIFLFTTASGPTYV